MVAVVVIRVAASFRIHVGGLCNATFVVAVGRWSLWCVFVAMRCRLVVVVVVRGPDRGGMVARW